MYIAVVWDVMSCSLLDRTGVSDTYYLHSILLLSMKREIAVSSETSVLVCATTVASQPANRNTVGSVGHENKIFRRETYVILFSVLLPSQDLRTKVSFCLFDVCAQSQVAFEPAECFISFWKKSMHQKLFVELLIYFCRLCVSTHPCAVLLQHVTQKLDATGCFEMFISLCQTVHPKMCVPFPFNC
jgi:hypothetical protein